MIKFKCMTREYSRYRHAEKKENEENTTHIRTDSHWNNILFTGCCQMRSHITVFFCLLFICFVFCLFFSIFAYVCTFTLSTQKLNLGTGRGSSGKLTVSLLSLPYLSGGMSASSSDSSNLLCLLHLQRCEKEIVHQHTGTTHYCNNTTAITIGQ